ncbi:ubiquitin-activating enzyme [Trypanosoma theileri]|uniref:Ubiquitin-activating enzyme n=1 Tax=Trypanosoma theileri TaxID=67003 RepID=A0A1X0NQG8_9TRYP|nr:ubiquitin-activating enzyme [Trypanosoma theileri]ORC86429.1 ubiquitin-activating enzyme [Trypanosoma theileri]
MRVGVAHVLFPRVLPAVVCDSAGASEAKRFKHEESIPQASLIAAAHNALQQYQQEQEKEKEEKHGVLMDSLPELEVHIHEGRRGASFCFVRGLLTMALTTPMHTSLLLPNGVTREDVEMAACYPRLCELTVVLPNGDVWNQLPLYWEDRTVLLPNTTPTILTTKEEEKEEKEETAAAAAVVSQGGVSMKEKEGNEKRILGVYADNMKDNSTDSLLLNRRLLLVGAGGIGCELLKVLVLRGFTAIDIVDLDTIDATNLNRQFLFEREDVGASKALTARAAILRWFTCESTCTSTRPIPVIHAHHANIKDSTYDETFFRQFALVLNALDNVGARQHVNRMCMRAEVPLIESGTMGYNGQVQPIVRGRFECYDCHPKSAQQQTVAVCTIHARPTTMVHCVHYAKELYERLFGDGQREQEDELGFVEILLDQQKQKQQEKQKQRDEKKEEEEENQRNINNIEDLRNTAIALADCLFREKISELLAMKSVWATTPPVPLDKEIVQDVAEQIKRDELENSVSDTSRDNAISLKETIALFIHSFVRCAQRNTRIPFKKEDDDTVDFIAAVSNLRAYVFHIVPPHSVEEIRSIAGAIVPAIATTNAVVAAAVVQQALCVLAAEEAEKTSSRSSYASPQMVYVRRAPQIRRRRLPCTNNNSNDSIIDADGNHNDINNNNNNNKQKQKQRWTTDLFLVHSAPPNPPNASCLVCRDCHPTVRVRLDAVSTTLGTFAAHVLRDKLSMSGASIFSGPNVLYEEGEYESLSTTPLIELMTADRKPLELVIDDLDHEVEWRVIVEHCEKEEQDQGNIVTMEGLDKALQLEQTLIMESKAAAVVTNTTSEAGNDAPPSKNGGKDDSKGDIVILSDSEESEEEVMVID